MKKNKPLPPCIEIPVLHYQKLIEQNTIEIYRAYIEPDKSFENGEETQTLPLDNYIEIRIVPNSFNLFYIYSNYSTRFWSTWSFDKANEIVKRELSYCNRICKDYNKHLRTESINEFMEKTDPLLKSAKNIINRKN